MAKIYRTSSVYKHTTGKKENSFDPQRVTLLGEDSICMVNLLETARVIVFFFSLHDQLASVVSEERFSFVKRA